MTAVGRLAGALLLVASVAAGCGRVPDVTTLPAPSPSPRPVLLVDEPTTASMNALGGGRIEVVGGCLGADGGVIVWPHGTRFVGDDPLTVEVPGHGRFALGDRISLGGGWIVEHVGGTVPDAPWTFRGQRVPDSCLAHDVFLAGPY
ncbi:hypothetical protein [Aeromicrobium sp. IC_218]|uniref:hypothetical protein n=1 Tax=Aeromicrobium sp. IC_218 TaxID=2545468 RepID=UPI00103FFEEA|nr:hypothetical protein [Aeromicrobium sp. IC_218]TCI98846.1 hypothetical protein E0W78_08820 [Aeromicrobium sp. IC_218]